MKAEMKKLLWERLLDHQVVKIGQATLRFEDMGLRVEVKGTLSRRLLLQESVFNNLADYFDDNKNDDPCEKFVVWRGSKESNRQFLTRYANDDLDWDMLPVALEYDNLDTALDAAEFVGDVLTIREAESLVYGSRAS